MTSLKLSDNPNWHGGRSITSHGYVIIKMPNHPYAMKSGYVYEHRLVAEKVLGRYLLPSELVHHKGDKFPKSSKENRSDNRPENLAVEGSIAEHKFEHREDSNRQKPGEPNPIILCACGCKLPIMKYDESGRPRLYITGHNSRGKLSYNPLEMISCACGCGENISRFDKYGRERKFISGHNTHLSNPNPHVKPHS